MPTIAPANIMKAIQAAPANRMRVSSDTPETYIGVLVTSHAEPRLGLHLEILVFCAFQSETNMFVFVNEPRRENPLRVNLSTDSNAFFG